jgi:hypothetical protein
MVEMFGVQITVPATQKKIWENVSLKVAILVLGGVVLSLQALAQSTTNPWEAPVIMGVILVCEAYEQQLQGMSTGARFIPPK